MKYICKHQLSIDEYDEDGFLIENVSKIISVGDVYEVVELGHNIVASNDAIHLEDENGSWIEIHKNTLEAYFEPVKE